MNYRIQNQTIYLSPDSILDIHFLKILNSFFLLCVGVIMAHNSWVFHIRNFVIGVNIHPDLDHGRRLLAESETSP